MTRPAPATATAARTVEAAAEQLDAWLQQQRRSVRGGDVPAAGAPRAADGLAADAGTAPGSTQTQPTISDKACEAASRDSAVPAIPGEGSAVRGAPLRLPHPDWLHHRLAATGPADALADFQAAACGAGTIPWQLDGDRLAEDYFHLLAAPPAPQRRRLSLAGARTLARQLREAVELRHAAACARVGHSQACPFDLHALVPVPPAILRLGPDEPAALAWLWQHWGTTAPLRHVAVAPAPALRQPGPAGTATLPISFWSADWTPWRALAAMRARWPTLDVDIRPTYGPL